ncbi:PorT family protein [Fibrella sp. HMF5335]|uniref:PorT family protein n=1 Tax=Fibrella rubiginis TaxID=2817060 RepID=A0A939K671_9BACT|nr:porin family protein [Fibrella rubiginis]MBO0937225.1 PorT family protein [Fibrella rubiginis]
MNRLFASALSLAALFVVTTTSFAQVQVGVRGGVNWSNVSEPSLLQNLPVQPEFSPGPTGAIFLEVPLSERVSFRPEVAFVQKGFLLREGTSLDLGFLDIPVGARVAYQIQSIQTPLLLKVNLSDGPVKPYFFAGPAVGYAFDGRVRTRATALFTTKNMDVPLGIGGAINHWDLGGVGGLGLSADMGAGKFFIEARYDHGFTRQLQVPLVNLPVRNRTVGVSVGYAFTL